MTNADKIQALKFYAEARYNTGFDIFVECYGEAEYFTLLESNNFNVAKAKKAMRDEVELHAEATSNCW